MEADDVRNFWRQSATHEFDHQGLRPTARDPFLQSVVEATMERHLSEDAALLDVGCGDGRSTIRFARRVRRVCAVDYIEKYVDRARAIASAAQIQNIEFACASVMDLGHILERSGPFDVALTIRCLISLTSWDSQRKAISEIAAGLRPGGLFMLSEGWLEGLENLNSRRMRVNLPPVEPARYNYFIKRSDFEREIKHAFDIVHYQTLGPYIFLSRVFHPLLVAPAAPRHDDRINEVAAAIQLANFDSDDFADCDYTGVYVLRKKTA